MEIWQMTLEEWMSKPREFVGVTRFVTLNEYRSLRGFNNPIDDHGDFRHPHGISKATRKRIDKRFQQRTKSMIRGAESYAKEKKNGTLTTIIDTHWIRADGLDTPGQLAAARLCYKKSVRKAKQQGFFPNS